MRIFLVAVIVADDVEKSSAFASFAARLLGGAWYVAEADDASAQFGIALKELGPVPSG